MLQRIWVLSNMNADTEQEKKVENYKFDTLLNFVNPEGFKQLLDQREGRTPKLEGEGEVKNGSPAAKEFLDDVESLPERRILRPGPVDDYVTKKMAELKGKLEKNGLEFKADPEAPLDPKPFTYTRRIVPKKTNG